MAKVNDEGKEYIADVSSGLRLTADIPNGELGYVLMAQLVTRYGITELLEINESDLNTQTRVGVYKYGIMQPGATKTDYGMLFVYSSDVPSSGSGDYPLYQTRFQDGKMQTRSRTMPNGLWSDWQEIGGVGKPGSGESSEVFNDMENNQAAGDCAHAEGSWTVANNEAEHAEGVYNKSNTGGSDSGKTLHSVGIGTADNARKNAHEIMLNGDHYVYGIGGYDGTNPGTAKTLQEVVNEGGGITDLGVVSGWNDVVDTGIYKYTLTTENGISGLLFVTSAPKRDGSGKDHYQVRMEAGKIYSRTGESLNIVSGRYTWQDWEEVGGGSSVSVVQSTGQSTTAVMSQKAVTDAIDNLNNGVMQDEGLYEDVDTYGEAYSRTSTNGEMMGYVNHRIEEYEVSTDDPSIFTYDDQVHTMKLAQFTVKPESDDLSFIEQNSRGVLFDPTWSYVNFYSPNEPRYFSARIGGGKCVLCDRAGNTNNADYYIQLYAEAAYSSTLGGIAVTVFVEYKLPTGEPDESPLCINGNLAGYLRIWIV